MNDNETQQILEEILDYAENGEPIEFRLIKSLADYRSRLISYKATKLVIKMLKQSSKSLFKTYCKDVTSGISDVTKLIAYSQLGDIIRFYEQDLKTLYDMLDEYEEYIWSGNLFYSLMGGKRF